MNYLEGLKRILRETTTTYGGVFGDTDVPIGSHGGAFKATDWYAPGDARNVFGLDVNPKKKSKKKSKKKKRKTKFPLYRRAFTEEVDPEPELILDCVMFVTEDYQDVVEKLLQHENISYRKQDCCFTLSGLDETLQHIITRINLLLDEKFEENVFCLIGEMDEFSFIDEEKFKEDVKKGMALSRKIFLSTISTGESLPLTIKEYETQTPFRMFYTYEDGRGWVYIEFDKIPEEYIYKIEDVGGWVFGSVLSSGGSLGLGEAIKWLRDELIERGVDPSKVVGLPDYNIKYIDQFCNVLCELKMGAHVF